jgi:Ran GTPase-activating protein (RanGAP) involved in mRNA processing and transport
VALIEALACNYTLRMLDLSDNQLSSEAGLNLVDGLEDNPSLTSVGTDPSPALP